MDSKEKFGAFDPNDAVVQSLTLYSDRHWTIVRTGARQEKCSAESCISQGIITYIPLITKLEIHNRAKRETHLPMFPGYFFACPTPDQRLFIRQCNGVLTLLPVQGVDEDFLIGDLMKVRESELLSQCHKLVVNPGLQPGDKVRIKNGPFKNQEVIVIRRDNWARVLVNLDFLGRNLEILCNADELIY